MRFPHGTISKVAAAFTLCTLVFVNLTAAQFKSTDEDSKSVKTVTRSELAPDPVLFPTTGNVTCQNLVDYVPPVGDPNPFDHMSSGLEYKIDPPVVGPDVHILTGINPTQSISTFLSNDRTMTSWSLSFSNPPTPPFYVVSAVILKGGPNGTNVYPYRNFSAGDSGSFIVPGGTNAISHISFCFELFQTPSSAPVSISGRVLTSTGDGIAYTRVDVVSLSTGEVYSAMTNNFGYYTVADLAAEETYMVTASHRRHTFINNQRTVTTTEDLFGVDFVAP